MPSITQYINQENLSTAPKNKAQTIDKTAEGKSNGDGVDTEQWPNAKLLVETASEFLQQIENLTPGKDLEYLLNSQYGPGNKYYEEFCRLVKVGLQEGWIANVELDGAKYRRSRVCKPCEATRFCSITAVYMEDKDHYAGQYHKHPYGEINCVVVLEEGAELLGFQGWRGAGWTCPAAGTHHYPEVRNGSLVALFFLPAGRISYTAKPGEAQPLCT